MNKIYKINLENIVWGSINKKTLLIKISSVSKKTNILGLKDVRFKLKSIGFELKGIGLEIWKMLIKNYGSRKILKKLNKKYPFSKKQIQADFLKFIKQLKSNKLIDEVR